MMNQMQSQAATFFNLLVQSVGDMKDDLAYRIKEQSQDLSPFKNGSLRKTIKDGTVGATFFNLDVTASYAAPVIFGSRAHVVRPVDKKALFFPFMGKMVFAKSVNIPAQPPNNFPLQAAMQVIESGFPTEALESSMRRHGLL